MVSSFATRLLQIDSRITRVKSAGWNDIVRGNVSLPFESSSSAAMMKAYFCFFTPRVIRGRTNSCITPLKLR
jgi:hypothetical protein